MNKKYRDLLQEVHVPENLNARVLAAARQQEVSAGREAKRPRLQIVACGLLALTLVAGGISFGSKDRTLEYNEGPEAPQMHFGLTAHAAGLGANGGILLEVPKEQDAAELDGTTQTLALTFADGREETGVYHLRTETLRTVLNEDGSEVLVPALEGEMAQTVSGIYAVPEESCWLLWPVDGSNTVSLSAPYGLREETNFFHAGIDIPAERGLHILSAAAGTVTEAGFDTARGNYLIIDHGDGLTTLYGHCQDLRAQTGDTVTAGMTVALVGATGMATGPHLHFEVRQDGEAQNPMAYFSAPVRDTLHMG